MDKVEESQKSKVLFGDVWKLYVERELIDRKYEANTITNRLSKERFLKGLFQIKMGDFSARTISQHISHEADKYMSGSRVSRRTSFKEEVKFLNTLFNWWKRESEDITFNNPVIFRKYVFESIVNKEKYREDRVKKMSEKELALFINSFKEGSVWKDLALTQFYLCSRIAEAAALNVGSIDWDSNLVKVNETILWDRETKSYMQVKQYPKNGSKEVPLGRTLDEIISRRMKDTLEVESNGSAYKLLFHYKGEPLKYRAIQYQYLQAIKKAGLDHKYSGTHFLRHTMATIARSYGDLDVALAIGGWKDRSIAQHYSKVGNKRLRSTIENIEKSFAFK